MLVNSFPHPNQFLLIAWESIRVDRRPIIGVPIHDVRQTQIILLVTLGSQDQQRLAAILNYPFNVLFAEFPSSRPDDQRFGKQRKGFTPGKVLDEVVQIRGNPVRRQWVPIKVQTLVDYSLFEIFFLSQIGQLLQTPVSTSVLFQLTIKPSIPAAFAHRIC